MKAIVIGGGLAGAEASLQLSKAGIEVDLYEMRPEKKTGAHCTEFLGELVCSNSLGSGDIGVASGLLKEEMRKLGGFLIGFADESKVPAGNALAVDRDVFAKKITAALEEDKNINIIRKELKEIPEDTPTIIASGPLTSDSLSENIAKFTGEDHLHFFDAVAPIVEKDSVNFDIAFYASRYGKGEASYINCPMDEAQYEKFYNTLIEAPKAELKNFEKDAKFFESCLPVEVIASRGKDTLRFGPLKPVGLIDERTNKQNFAVVQLRQDNMTGTLYNLVGFQTNLKWGAQKELIQTIPGLENATIVRYGVMHRNTFIHSPNVLKSTLQTQKKDNLFFAGQITGVEGYTESIATGMLAGINLARFLKSQELLNLDSSCILGALTDYITFKEHKRFQPINSNWGILKPMKFDRKIKKDKKRRNAIYAQRSLDYIEEIMTIKS